MNLGLINRSHLEAARLAVDLFAIGSTVYPGEWTETVTEAVVSRSLEFAIHARRLLEMAFKERKLDFQMNETVQKVMWKDPPLIETSFRSSLNRIIHAQDLTVKYIPSDIVRFEKSYQNYVVGFIVAATDQKLPAHIPLTGLSITYMGDVLSALRNRVPELFRIIEPSDGQQA